MRRDDFREFFEFCGTVQRIEGYGEFGALSGARGENIVGGTASARSLEECDEKNC